MNHKKKNHKFNNKNNHKNHRFNGLGGSDAFASTMMGWGNIAGAGIVNNGASSPLTKGLATQLGADNSPISLNQIELNRIYRTYGIVQAGIDTPVDDAFRDEIIIKSQELGESVQDLHKDIKENQIISTIAQTWKWVRLFGGGGIVIQAPGNPAKLLDIDQINENTNLQFYAADRWQLSNISNNNYDNSPYEKNTQNDAPYYFKGHNLHESRVIKINGMESPSLLRPQFMGWGMSELEKVIRPLEFYIEFQNILFQLVKNSNIKILKIKGLNQYLSDPMGEMKLMKWLHMNQTIENYQAKTILSSEDDLDQKTLSFGGFAEIFQEISRQMATAWKIPILKLMGEPSQGFSTGEDTFENYNSMVEGSVRKPAEGVIIKMLKLRCKKIFGYIPEDLTIEWRPLRVLNAEQTENVKTQIMQRILSAVSSGLINTDEALEQINAGGCLPNPVKSNANIL